MPKLASLFDYSGVWSKPYKNAGWEVIQIDLQLGQDILDQAIVTNLDGIIIQPPCTDFANSGARWFAEKDEDGRTQYSISLVNRAMEWIDKNPSAWWVLENPAGRIHKLVPRLGQPVFIFSPHEYGEKYRKTTWLWGTFTPPPKTTPMAPILGIRPRQPDAWYSAVGGSSLATKNYRSRTSEKFAKEFFKYNQGKEN